jgi:hypothetical protein
VRKVRAAMTEVDAADILRIGEQYSEALDEWDGEEATEPMFDQFFSDHLLAHIKGTETKELTNG